MQSGLGSRAAESAVVNGAGSRRVRLALATAALVYFAGLLLNALGAPLEEVIPRPLLYFMQVARLFPNAVEVTIEYRAEAYDCEQQRWTELDVRPYFPLRPDDKENRFDRAMFFYRRSAPVMKALDEYLVSANNRAGRAPIGGVMLLSLRIPVPAPGRAVEPYRRRPLADYPAGERKYWYRTSRDDFTARCDEEAHRREATSP
jgi:hypothetical protein